MALEQTLEQIIKNGELLHTWLHGGEDGFVTTQGGQIPTIANLAKRASIALAASWSTVSKTAHTVSTGSKVFVVGVSKGFQPGQTVVIVGDNVRMHADVISYTGTSLSVNVTTTEGIGTFEDWTITLSGPSGKDGKPGAAGKNLYLLAVEAGFTGSFDDFLESLRGPPGESSGSAPKLLTVMPWEETSNP